jgi:hypothetical protein
MRFRPLKSSFVGIVFLVVPLFLLLISTAALIETGDLGAIFVFLLALVVIWFFSSIWFKTYYIIENDTLFYRSGPVKGKVPISSIRSIKYNHSFAWYGVRPALSMRGGMLIKYNKWDVLYIAPNDKSGFISELQKINPDITVEE